MGWWKAAKQVEGQYIKYKSSELETQGQVKRGVTSSYVVKDLKERYNK